MMQIFHRFNHTNSTAFSTAFARRQPRHGSTHCVLALVLVALCQFAVVAQTAPPKLLTQMYARQYTAFAARSCDKVEANLPEITRVAEIVADRHLKGGLIGFIGNGHGLHEELVG